MRPASTRPKSTLAAAKRRRVAAKGRMGRAPGPLTNPRDGGISRCHCVVFGSSRFQHVTNSV